MQQKHNVKIFNFNLLFRLTTKSDNMMEYIKSNNYNIKNILLMKDNFIRISFNQGTATKK